MGKKRLTLAEQFCETYIRHAPECCYILLPVLLTNRVLGKNPEMLLVPEGKPQNIMEVDGVPAYRIRHKMQQAIIKRGDSPKGVYGALNQIFKDAAIKALFLEPNIWLLNHNALAKKQQATDLNRFNYLKKHDPKGLALHKQCFKRTNNRSVAITAREIRSLAS